MFFRTAPSSGVLHIQRFNRITYEDDARWWWWWFVFWSYWVKQCYRGPSDHHFAVFEVLNNICHNNLLGKCVQKDYMNVD